MCGWRLESDEPLRSRSRKILQDIVAAGHIVGNHTVHHRVLPSLSPQQVADIHAYLIGLQKATRAAELDLQRQGLGPESIPQDGQKVLIQPNGNVADDVTYSGTIAGAMEGCLLGIPSIAFSQAYTHGHPVKWGTGTHHGAAVARKVLTAGWPRNVFINVNFPDVVAASVKGTRVTRQGVRGFGGHIVERTDPRGGAYTVGFGLVTDLAVFPHHGSAPAHLLERSLELLPRRAFLAGVDDHTALVREPDGTWRVVGDGWVTVYAHTDGPVATQIGSYAADSVIDTLSM